MSILFFDTGEQFADRYTAVYTSIQTSDGYIPITSMSENCNQPNGCSIHDLIKKQHLKNLGNRITFKQLPETCQKVVTGELRKYYHDKKFTVKESLMWYHKMGLMQTATGYGEKLNSGYMIQFEGEKVWRRVYCHIFSNIGSLYVLINGIRVYVDFHYDDVERGI